MSSTNEGVPPRFIFAYLRLTSYNEQPLQVRLPCQPQTLGELHLLRFWLLRLGGTCYDWLSVSQLNDSFYHPRFLEALLSSGAKKASSPFLLRCLSINSYYIFDHEISYWSAILRHLCIGELGLNYTGRRDALVQLLKILPANAPPPQIVKILHYSGSIADTERQYLVKVVYFCIILYC
jgi:hypothetical protein